MRCWTLISSFICQTDAVIENRSMFEKYLSFLYYIHRWYEMVSQEFRRIITFMSFCLNSYLMLQIHFLFSRGRAKIEKNLLEIGCHYLSAAIVINSAFVAAHYILLFFSCKPSNYMYVVWMSPFVWICTGPNKWPFVPVKHSLHNVFRVKSLQHLVYNPQVPNFDFYYVRNRLTLLSFNNKIIEQSSIVSFSFWFLICMTWYQYSKKVIFKYQIR